MKVVVKCGNKKCQKIQADPYIEINFFTNEVIYVCPDCSHNNIISLKKQAEPYPSIRKM